MGLFDRFRRRDSRPIASGTTARREDSLGGAWANAYMGVGSGIDRDSESTFEHGVPMPYSVVDSMMEFSAIARRIVNREPDDASREGYQITGVDASVSRAVLDYAEATTDVGLTVMATIADARRWARAYGGGGVVGMLDDGREPHEPLDLASLRAVRGLEAFDRWELQPIPNFGMDPHDLATFGRPTHYHLSTTGRSLKIHASRVIPFDGFRLPRRVARQRQEWGGGVLDLVREELQNYGISQRLVPRLLSRLTQAVFKSKYLGDTVSAEGSDLVVERMEAIRLAQGIMGDIVIDQDHEEYEIQQRSLAGVRDAVDAVVSALVAATDMPRSILLGETPGGLNTGENAGETRAWYDHVATMQRNLYAPRLRRALTWIMRSSEGPTAGQVPAQWGIAFAPLWQMTEAERATIDLQRAQRRQIDITSTAVSAAEVRRDPSLVSLYGIDPDAPPPADVVPGEMGDDEDLSELTIVPGEPGKMPPGEALISARAAGERLGVGPAAVHAMAGRGEITAWRIGGQWRFAWSEIAETRERKGLRAV